MYNITEASAVALIMKAKTQLIEIVHASAVNKLRVLSLLLTALQNLSAQVKRQLDVSIASTTLLEVFSGTTSGANLTQIVGELKT